MRQIQGADVKLLADVSNQTLLVNDTKFYSPSKAKTLRNVIVDGDFSSINTPIIVVNSTVDSYDMSATATNTMLIHKYTSFAYYNLPVPTASKRLLFSNEQDIPSDSTSIVVSGTNNTIYWTSNSINYTAIIASATYTRATLMTEVKTQMDASADANVFTTSYDNITKQYKIVAGTNTFRFTFGTNTTNSARKVLGLLAVDGTLSLTQYSEPLSNDMRIKLSSGTKAYIGSSLIEYPGYIVLSKRGTSATLIALDSTTWLVQEIIGEESHKNTNLGIATDYNLVGRDTWVTKATAGTARSGVAGFALNGYGYSCDGTTGSVSNEVNQYNDTANTWATKATGGTARRELAGFSLNGYGYICNGSTGAVSNLVDQYNDSTNIWTSKATGGTARFRLAAFSLNGYGYICNGTTGADSNLVDQYNDSANTWVSRSTGGTARSYLTGFSLNGYGYICNGLAGASSNEVNQYNDSANTWTTKATGGTARAFLAGFSSNGYGYICNGDLGNEVNQYNDSTNIWTTKATGGTAREGLGSFSTNGYGYICNGTTGSVSNEVNQYN